MGGSWMLVEHMQAMRRVADAEHQNTLQKVVELLPKFTKVSNTIN